MPTICRLNTYSLTVAQKKAYRVVGAAALGAGLAGLLFERALERGENRGFSAPLRELAAGLAVGVAAIFLFLDGHLRFRLGKAEALQLDGSGHGWVGCVACGG